MTTPAAKGARFRYLTRAAFGGVHQPGTVTKEWAATPALVRAIAQVPVQVPVSAPAAPLPTLAIRIDWDEIECEPGWGVTTRPDGFEIYRTEALAEAAIAKNKANEQRGGGYSCNWSPSKPKPHTLTPSEAEAMAASETGVLRFRK